MSARSINSVFYAQSYHPIQAGSIDGTDILPHDNAVWRAHLCSSAALYDPFGDPKVIGDPQCTVFVGRLSHRTDEESLRKAMSKYGRVKNLRLVRHIVTGASRGYAFVEYETEREMRRAYEDAHHSLIDDSEVIVDYNRQQLMPGWIPRRLGGGLGGKKESGQLRFGGRERPFRAPLRIPYDELKRLGIPLPPEGRYMSRFQVPSPPRRTSSTREGSPSRHRRSEDREEHSRRRSSHREDSPRRPMDTEKPSRRSSNHISREDSLPRHQISEDREEPFSRRSSHIISGDLPPRHRRPEDTDEPSRRRDSHINKDLSSRHRRSEDREEPRHRRRSSPSAVDESSHKRHRHHSEHSHRDKKRSTIREYSPPQYKRSTSREYSP